MGHTDRSPGPRRRTSPPVIAPGKDRHAGTSIVDACIDAPARSRPRPRRPLVRLAYARILGGVGGVAPGATTPSPAGASRPPAPDRRSTTPAPPLASVGRSTAPLRASRHWRSRMLRAHAATQSAAVRTDPTVAATISRLTSEFRDQPGPRTVERIVFAGAPRPRRLASAGAPGAVGTPRPATPARDGRAMNHSTPAARPARMTAGVETTSGSQTARGICRPWRWPASNTPSASTPRPQPPAQRTQRDPADGDQRGLTEHERAQLPRRCT